MDYKAKIATTLFILVYLMPFVEGQVTKIRGTVVDDETGEPLPFSGVSFKGTTIATITGMDGTYSLETRTPLDTLFVTCVGYETQKALVIKNTFQELDFRLKHNISVLDEVIIYPGENPAHPILKKIIENKQKNNPDNFVDSYQYEMYNKYQLEINNVDSAMKNRKIFSSLDFVFDYMDTSALTGKAYLPVFLVESVSDFYYRKQPPIKREIIKASKISGIDNPSVSQFTGKTFQQFNIYDNTLSILEQDFVSPISSYGLMYYRYYIVDTAFIDNYWCYQIAFHPRRISERTFSGYFWVNDTTWAIKSISMQFGKEPNINFLNNFSANLTFNKFDSIWFVTSEDYVTDFNMTNSTTGFFATKSSVYRNFKFNQALPREIVRISSPTVVADTANHVSELYWDSARPYKLSQKEKDIYSVVDSVKQLRIYRIVEDAIYLVADYYYIIGPFEYGPYYTTYSFNPIEGNRFRVGGRTSNAFSTKIMFEGYLAYGTLDNEFKYKLGMLYMFSKNPRRALYASYKDDIIQMSSSENAYKEDNILSSILRTSPNYNLTPSREFKIYYETDLGWGFSGRTTILIQAVDTTKYMHFRMLENGIYATKGTVKNAEFTIGIRYAKSEKFLWGEFERYSLGTKSPIINFDFSLGTKISNLGEFEYYKFHLGVADKIQLNPFGFFKFKADAGIILGHVPYLYLELHPGNETYSYDFYAFSLMNYYEFVSDKYFSFIGEQHFQGFFLNKVPLVERLNLREVISFKMVTGDVSRQNLEYLDPPAGMSSVNKPYMEVGVGIENILRVFRVDVFWRLTYLDKPEASPFGVRFLFQFIL